VNKLLGPEGRLSYTACATALLASLAAGTILLSLPRDRSGAAITAAHNRGNVAPLPQSAHQVRGAHSSPWNDLFSSTTYLRFEASPADIAAFLATSPGVQHDSIHRITQPQERPQDAPDWYRVPPGAREYFVRGNSFTSGTVTIDDTTGTVLIQLHQAD